MNYWETHFFLCLGLEGRCFGVVSLNVSIYIYIEIYMYLNLRIDPGKNCTKKGQQKTSSREDPL